MGKNKSNSFKVGSIVYTSGSIFNEPIDCIGVVSIVSRGGQDLYIDHIMSRGADSNWENFRSLYPEYEGEYAKDCRLINAEEFEEVLDGGIIPREELINV